MAKKLFFVDTEAVKHDAATAAQIPLYDPLPEQWEKATAAIQKLWPRFAYVKERGADPVLIRTETIRPYHIAPTAVEELQRELARTHGGHSQVSNDLSRSCGRGSRFSFSIELTPLSYVERKCIHPASI